MKKFFWIFVFIPFFSTAQERVSVDLSSPKATIYTHLYFLQDDTFQPKKSAKTIFEKNEKKAISIAIKIKKVLDGKGLFVDFNQIPDANYHKDSTKNINNQKYVLFPQRMPQISVENNNNQWYYSSETIANIDELYREIYPWYALKLQEIIPVSSNKKIGGQEVWKYTGALILLILAFVIFFLAKKITFGILQIIQLRISKKTSIEVKEVLKKLAHPISLLVALTFVDRIFPSLQFSLNINKWVFLGLNITETTFWIYIFLNLVKVIMNMYSNFTETTHGKLDNQLVPILNNFLIGLVLILGFFNLLQLFGVDTTTLLAGATIGGLAFALASQDTVKNLIGTIMIFVDKPFHIDDWIEAGEVVGMVEKVGFRSTRVRAADTSMYQIPNSKLSEIVINNKGLRLFRRYNTKLGLRYDTPPELIEAFVTGIRKIIIAHPETKSDAYNVEFTGFGDSALLIMINMYFNSLAWDVKQSSKHRLHIAIIKLAKELGVDFAFPSTTVTIEQFPEKKALDLEYNTSPEKIAASIKKVMEDFSKEK